MRENAPHREGVTYAKDAEVYDARQMAAYVPALRKAVLTGNTSELEALLPPAPPVTIEIGLKYDSDKLRYDLLPPAALRGLVEIITFGAKNYGPENWKLVQNARRRYFAAAMRHAWAWFAGQKLDPETGKPHLWHFLCNVAFLAQLEEEGKLDEM